jgi:hypothetical protein
MRTFAKSMMSYTWALSVFSVQQAINLLAPGQGCEQTAKAKTAFDNVTDATIGTFDQALKNVFAAGDKVQQQMVEVMFSGFVGGGLDPSRWIRMGNNVMKRVGNWNCGANQGSSVAAPPWTTPVPSPPNTSGVGPPPQPPEPGWGPMPRQ